MDRRTIASGLAAVAGVSIVAAQLVGWLDVSPSSFEVGPGVSAWIIAPAIPLVGAVLVRQRRSEGVAVLAVAALIGLPAIVSMGYLLVSSSPPGTGRGYALLHLVAQVAMVAAGIAAWGLRDADRWRWNRPVLAPFVALSVVAILPMGALLVTMHGPFFPLEIITRLNVLDLSWLAQLAVAIGLLVWAARLPRRTAAVVLLVMLVPRLVSSVTMLSSGSSSGVTTEPFAALGLTGEAALIATACWWLTRADELTTRTDVVDPATHGAH